jgi:hypothetical protein
MGMNGRAPDSPVEGLLEELRRLTDAGNELAEAAHRVSSTSDGVHRLRLALAGWYTALANEWGRGDMAADADVGFERDLLRADIKAGNPEAAEAQLQRIKTIEAATDDPPALVSLSVPTETNT